MNLHAMNEARSRLVELAVDLGWTPPGWRTQPHHAGLVDRLGDLALAWLETEQRSDDAAS